MNKFEYISIILWEKKQELVNNIINRVTNDINNIFPVKFEYTESVTRDMVTCNYSRGIGYDFDLNIIVNKNHSKFSPEEIRTILINSINKYSSRFDFSNCEDGIRVFTIKSEDLNNKVVHTVDFTIVEKLVDGRQKFIKYNTEHNTYSWVYQSKAFYKTPEKLKILAKNGLIWKVRKLYLSKKASNIIPDKKSRSVFIETVSQVYDANLSDEIKNKYK